MKTKGKTKMTTHNEAVIDYLKQTIREVIDNDCKSSTLGFHRRKDFCLGYEILTNECGSRASPTIEILVTFYNTYITVHFFDIKQSDGGLQVNDNLNGCWCDTVDITNDSDVIWAVKDILWSHGRLKENGHKLRNGSNLKRIF